MKKVSMPIGSKLLGSKFQMKIPLHQLRPDDLLPHFEIEL